ncbi:MAG: hypothetical protein CMJ79_01030 [Planctomycetaceae bacterium]|nr:hypothetical protein [Planctomycetaceae bacterium]
MKRRNLLKLCTAVGLGFASPVGERYLLKAEEDTSESPPYEGPYYIVINASGGWDTTYMMDPKGVNEINRLYQQDDILTQGNIRYAPNAKHTTAGMSNEEFFGKYANELLVFNGLDYSVNNHSPCSRYMATGKLDSLEYPTFAALVAACKGSETPLAFLTFGQYSATGNLVPLSRVPYLSSLKRLANADGVDGSQRTFYSDDFVRDRIDAALIEQRAAQVNSPRLPRQQRAENMLYAAQFNSKALNRITPYIPKTQSKGRLPSQVDIALASFKAGVCVSANLSIGQFDSHANNDLDQMKLIPEFLAGIDYLATKADELHLRDKLVIVIQSEMGRTPTYNKGNGKDHWSVGSVMFMGAGIRGNRVIGETDDKQFLVPINPGTLATDESLGIRVRPEHIHAALREFAGISNHSFSRKFPLDIPAGEKLEKFWG